MPAAAAINVQIRSDVSMLKILRIKMFFLICLCYSVAVVDLDDWRLLCTAWGDRVCLAL